MQRQPAPGTSAAHRALRGALGACGSPACRGVRGLSGRRGVRDVRGVPGVCKVPQDLLPRGAQRGDSEHLGALRNGEELLAVGADEHVQGPRWPPEALLEGCILGAVPELLRVLLVVDRPRRHVEPHDVPPVLDVLRAQHHNDDGPAVGHALHNQAALVEGERVLGEVDPGECIEVAGEPVVPNVQRVVPQKVPLHILHVHGKDLLLRQVRHVALLLDVLKVAGDEPRHGVPHPGEDPDPLPRRNLLDEVVRDVRVVRLGKDAIRLVQFVVVIPELQV
mmetsp:Transcript_100082/g.311834  ORF Transcript_100082/g.311834 Transcript_100082/m.311834 type:complete len:278 (-) Transcript_100082:293-1126(-)